MKTINGLSLITAFNDQMNNRFGTEKDPTFFTDRLKELYIPLNDPKVEDNKFLSKQDMADNDTSIIMVQNVVNRFQFLDTFISIVSHELQNAYVSNNNFRIQLITKGCKVIVSDGKLKSYSYKKYTFPTGQSNVDYEVDNKDFIDLGNAPARSQEGSCILDWLGCSVVLPKEYKIRTVINPEISFPVFYFKDLANDKTVSFFETNWGLNILKSDNSSIKISINGEDRKTPQHSNRLSYVNQFDKIGEHLSISATLEDAHFEEGSVLVFELPLRTPEQDILLKITDEDESEAPIFFTCCT